MCNPPRSHRKGERPFFLLEGLHAARECSTDALLRRNGEGVSFTDRDVAKGTNHNAMLRPAWRVAPAVDLCRPFRGSMINWYSLTQGSVPMLPHRDSTLGYGMSALRALSRHRWAN